MRFGTHICMYVCYQYIYNEVNTTVFVNDSNLKKYTHRETFSIFRGEHRKKATIFTTGGIPSGHER